MTNPRVPPPIEPLSDAAWTRVEAGLFARLDRAERLSAGHGAPSEAAPPARSRALRAWSPAAACAAAAALALWLSSGGSPAPSAGAPERAAPASRAEGPAAPTAPTAPTAPAAAPAAPRQLAQAAPPGSATRVAGGTRVATAAGPERLLVGESELTLAEGSALGVEGDDERGFRLTLDRGRIDCHVTPRASRPAFVVDAGEVRVTVIGTRFSVMRSPAETRVEVQTGSVRVATGGQSQLLSAGQSWSSAPPAEVRAPGAAKADPAALFERATGLERSNPEAARRLYRELRRRPGPWAANALFAEARLELERDRTERGRSLLELYLSRYPDGANAADARALLERR